MRFFIDCKWSDIINRGEFNFLSIWIGKKYKSITIFGFEIGVCNG